MGEARTAGDEVAAEDSAASLADERVTLEDMRTSPRSAPWWG